MFEQVRIAKWSFACVKKPFSFLRRSLINDAIKYTLVPTHTAILHINLTPNLHFDSFTATCWAWTSVAGYGLLTVCDPVSSSVLLAGTLPGDLSPPGPPCADADSAALPVVPPVRLVGRYDCI